MNSIFCTKTQYMNIINIGTDALVNIIEFSSDVQDWISFMGTCKYIQWNIYPFFISKKFNFMCLYYVTLPKCITNDNKRFVKILDKYGNDSYVITNQLLISAHSQFVGNLVYETYGLFFSGLILSCCDRPKIDYEKIFNVLNSYLDPMHFSSVNFTDIFEYPHVSIIGTYKSLEISIGFIKRYRNHSFEYMKRNLNILYGNFSRHVKHNDIIYCRTRYHVPDNYIGLCAFCHTELPGDTKNSIHQCVHNDGHGNSCYELII